MNASGQSETSDGGITDTVHDVVIAGSGVAGLSAAVYAARADLEPLVLEGTEPGGQLTLTTDVENYLGFPDGVGGMELVQRGKAQAERFGATFVRAGIDAATLDARPFALSLSTGETIETRSLIIATGASARWVDAKGEAELMGYGLSTCATCDGAFHRGNDVLVIGGGDSAMEEALFLAKFADSVTVVHRRDELRASEIMARRVREHDAIEIAWNAELVSLHGSRDAGVTGATLVRHPEGQPRDRLADDDDPVECETVDVQGVFYAVGHTPNTGFLRDTPVELDESGHLRTREGTATAVAGVFGAGDVVDSHYRQAITAAGTGAMAGLDAADWLDARAHEADAAGARSATPQPAESTETTS